MNIHLVFLEKKISGLNYCFILINTKDSNQ